MEHRQLLETLVFDLLNSPVNPLNQYRDFQISHICKQIGVNEYGGQRDAIFFKNFATHFISYLNEKNELSSIIQQAQITRNQQKTQELQEYNQISQPQKSQPIQTQICQTPKNDVVQIIDDDVVESNKRKIDLEASLPKSYFQVPNFIGVNLDINNNQFNKTNDNTKHVSTKTASNKQEIKLKDPKLIPDLILKKKIDKIPSSNDCHNKSSIIKLKKLLFFYFLNFFYFYNCCLIRLIKFINCQHDDINQILEQYLIKKKEVILVYILNEGNEEYKIKKRDYLTYQLFSFINSKNLLQVMKSKVYQYKKIYTDSYYCNNHQQLQPPFQAKIPHGQFSIAIFKQNIPFPYFDRQK